MTAMALWRLETAAASIMAYRKRLLQRLTGSSARGHCCAGRQSRGLMNRCTPPIDLIPHRPRPIVMPSPTPDSGDVSFCIIYRNAFNGNNTKI